MLEDPAPPVLADERLSLLFACTHPAVDEAARAPLMLQVVLGLDAERIASAYVVAPATMSQRLVRAKARIKDAGIRFAVPEASQWPERMESVLAAIYAAYTLGRADGPRDLSTEAVSLARLLVNLVPEEPEARGLLALCLHCEARTAAQWQGGLYTPLPEQDVQLWHAELQAEADHHLSLAAKAQRSGATSRGSHPVRARSQARHRRHPLACHRGLVSRPANADLGTRSTDRTCDCSWPGPRPGHGLESVGVHPFDRSGGSSTWWAAKAEFLGPARQNG